MATPEHRPSVFKVTIGIADTETVVVVPANDMRDAKRKALNWACANGYGERALMSVSMSAVPYTTDDQPFKLYTYNRKTGEMT